jgi:hypothetical protein
MAATLLEGKTAGKGTDKRHGWASYRRACEGGGQNGLLTDVNARPRQGRHDWRTHYRKVDADRAWRQTAMGAGWEATLVPVWVSGWGGGRDAVQRQLRGEEACQVATVRAAYVHVSKRLGT